MKDFDWAKHWTPTAISSNTDSNATKPLTRKQYKNLLRLYFTVRRSTVEACGHKIDTDHQPYGNCQMCWFAWFNCHGELVKAIDELLHKAGGESLILGFHGHKFLRNYRRFMSTIAHWKAKAEAKTLV